MSRIVIGLHGPIGSGKDTLARGLRQAVSDRRVLSFKFARALYAMAQQIDPAFYPEMLHDAKEAPLLGRPELGTRRNFLEKLGTEFGRNLIDPDFWVKTLEADIAFAEPVVAVVTDVRFPNEAAWIRKNGILVHLQPDWITVGSDSRHASNAGLDQEPMDIVLPLRKGDVVNGVKAMLKILEAMEDQE